MVVASTLLAQSRKRNAKKSSEQGDSVDVAILLVGVATTLGATILAYMANKSRGQPCAFAMAFVAFSFPEIYLLQAGARAMLGDYKLSTSKQVGDTQVAALLPKPPVVDTPRASSMVDSPFNE